MALLLYQLLEPGSAEQLRRVGRHLSRLDYVKPYNAAGPYNAGYITLAQQEITQPKRLFFAPLRLRLPAREYVMQVRPSEIGVDEQHLLIVGDEGYCEIDRYGCLPVCGHSACYQQGLVDCGLVESLKLVRNRL